MNFNEYLADALANDEELAREYELITPQWEDKFVRILETDDWIVDYDKETNRYRVSYFEDFHFVDDVLFDAYEGKETNKPLSVVKYLQKIELPECKWSDEEIKEMIEQAKQNLINDGYDLQELKEYVG